MSFSSLMKHIDSRYYFLIRSLLEEGELLHEKIFLGSQNLVDVLTKPLTIAKLKLCASANLVGLHV